MQRVQYDLELLYVQKIYYFMFLGTFAIVACAITLWRFGWKNGLFVLGSGLILSYIAMLKKKDFIPPGQKKNSKTNGTFYFPGH